jgi:ABC-type maltose transport system permease subunit
MLVTFASYILAALILLDGITTYLAIRSGAVERNPVRRWLIERLGLKVGTLGVAVVLAVVAVLAYSPLSSLARQTVQNGEVMLTFGYVLASVVYAYAFYQNAKRINSLRGR